MSIWKDIKKAEKEFKEIEKRIAAKEARLRAKGIKVDYSSIEKPEDQSGKTDHDKKSIWDTINEVREKLNAKMEYLRRLERKCDQELKRI